MLLTSKIMVTWNHKNKEHFITKGYRFTKIGDKFEVASEDMLKESKVVKVDVKCDGEICNFVKKNTTFELSYVVDKFYCRACSMKNLSTRNMKIRLEVLKKEMDKCKYTLISVKSLDNKIRLEYICNNHHDKGVNRTSFFKFMDGLWMVKDVSIVDLKKLVKKTDIP